MSMSFGLATTLNTSQKLTPQMQQAIKLLQLSSLELAQEVQAKLDSNPLLERVEEDEDDYVDWDGYDSHNGEPLTLDSWNRNTSVDSFAKSTHALDDGFDYSDNSSDSLDKLQQASFDDEAIDNYAVEGHDYCGFTSCTYASAAIGSGILSAHSASGKYADFSSYQGCTSATIQDHVRCQLNFKRLSETDTLTAEYLM